MNVSEGERKRSIVYTYVSVAVRNAAGCIRRKLSNKSPCPIALRCAGETSVVWIAIL